MNDIRHPQPQCPNCQQIMHPAQRIIRRGPPPRLRVGSPAPPVRVLLVWRCEECAIDAPRIDEAAHMGHRLTTLHW